MTISDFEKMVRHLFETYKSRFTEDDVDVIDNLITHNESGVAYETILPLLYEYKIPITKESYELAAKTGKAMNHKESYWMPLKELIRNEQKY